MCATAGYQKTYCTGIAAATWFYQTQNSNQFGQNIGLLFYDNIVECNVSQEKNKLSRNYPRWLYIHKRDYLG